MKNMKFKLVKKTLPLLCLSLLTACSFTIGDFNESFDASEGSVISSLNSQTESTILNIAAQSFETSLTKMLSGYSITGDYDICYSVPVISTYTDENGVEQTDSYDADTTASFNFIREMGSLTSVDDLRDLPTGVKLTNVNACIDKHILKSDSNINIPPSYEAEVLLGTNDGYAFADFSNTTVSTLLTNFLISKMGGDEYDEGSAEATYIAEQVNGALDTAIGNNKKTYFNLKSIFEEVNASSLVSGLRESVGNLASDLVKSFNKLDAEDVNDMMTIKQYSEDSYGFKFGLDQLTTFKYLYTLLKEMKVKEDLKIMQSLNKLSSSKTDIFSKFDLNFDLRLSPTTGIRTFNIGIDITLPNGCDLTIQRNAVFTYKTPTIPDQFDLTVTNSGWYPYTEWIDETSLPSTKSNGVYTVKKGGSFEIKTLLLNLGSQFAKVTNSNDDVLTDSNTAFTAQAAGSSVVTVSFADVDFVSGSPEFTYTVLVTESEDQSTCLHSFTSEITKAATCSETGTVKYTCSECGISYTEVIPLRAHKYYDTEPTGAGYRDSEHNVCLYDDCDHMRDTNFVEINGTEYESLGAALAAVPTDGTKTTLKLINDESIEGNTGWEIKAGQNIELDLNGYLLKNVATKDDFSQVLTNNGTLTIKDSTDVEKNGTGTGCLSNDCASGVSAGSYWTGKNYYTNVITNNGVLIIDSGKIINKCSGTICYCVDNFAECTINGGWLYNYYTCAIRVGLYNGGGNVLTVNGGTIEGYNAIWVQNPSAGAAPTGHINLTGGTFKTTQNNIGDDDENTKLYDGDTYIYNTGYESSGYNPSNIYFDITGGVFYENLWVCGTMSHCSISGGIFHGAVYIASDDCSITGGTFISPNEENDDGDYYFDEDYLADGYTTTPSLLTGYVDVIEDSSTND